MEEDLKKCVAMLKAGKIILYPTDTIWGLGCDATNAAAIERLYEIKERQSSKSMIILVEKTDRIPLYVSKIPLIAWDLITKTYRPTTYIYPTAQNLPNHIIHSDGSVAIRIVKNKFCKRIISLLGHPIVSTSANISTEPAPEEFSNISNKLKERVDYIVPEKYAETIGFKASRIIKFLDDYNFIVVRE